MKKETTTNIPAYTFNPDKKFTKYTFDGESWLNAGQFLEALRQYQLTGNLFHDGNTAFCDGSDIVVGDRNISVKSGKASLAEPGKLDGETVEEMLKSYFEQTDSNEWNWEILVDDTLVTYIMDAEEFREFTIKFGWIDGKKLRYLQTSGKMIRWFEARLG